MSAKKDLLYDSANKGFTYAWEAPAGEEQEMHWALTQEYFWKSRINRMRPYLKQFKSDIRDRPSFKEGGPPESILTKADLYKRYAINELEREEERER